jgi:hypothetical protein
MNAVERNLLLRVARRLEEQAEATFQRDQKLGDEAAIAAKRRRDRELGDARDVREYVKRVDGSPHKEESNAGTSPRPAAAT